MQHLNNPMVMVMLPAWLALSMSAAWGQADNEPQSQPTPILEEATVMGFGDGTNTSVFVADGTGAAAPLLTPGAFNSIGSVMPAPDSWNMIGNPSVQLDLNLTADQKQKIGHLKRGMGDEMREMVNQFTHGIRSADIAAQMKATQDRYRERMREHLLPEQIDRLKQIALQMHMKRAGVSAAITSNVVVEALDISPQQQENLAAKSKELAGKLADQIKELKANIRAELLAELTPGQRQKLAELQGDAYQPKQSDWSDRFKAFRNRSLQLKEQPE